MPGRPLTPEEWPQGLSTPSGGLAISSSIEDDSLFQVNSVKEALDNIYNLINPAIDGTIQIQTETKLCTWTYDQGILKSYTEEQV